jgi:general secretion pathway protein I
MNSRSRGFTLLEVLVATVLMGVAVAGLLGALRASLNNAARLVESERAAALARRQMDELLAMRLLPKGVPLEGRFTPEETGGAEAGWRAVVRPFEGMTVVPGTVPPVGSRILDRIQMEVWWNSGQARRSFTLTAYRSAMMTPADIPFFESMPAAASGALP